MNRKDIETSIASYQQRLAYRKEKAMDAIKENNFWVAQLAMCECVGFVAVINELEFQLECMEANHV